MTAPIGSCGGNAQMQQFHQAKMQFQQDSGINMRQLTQAVKQQDAATGQQFDPSQVQQAALTAIGNIQDPNQQNQALADFQTVQQLNPWTNNASATGGACGAGAGNILNINV